MGLCEEYARLVILGLFAVAHRDEFVDMGMFIMRGKGRVILRAKHDALLGLPKMWRKRQEIQKNCIVSVGEIWRVMDKRLFPSKKGR